MESNPHTYLITNRSGKGRGIVVALHEGEETREEALARAGVDPELYTMTIFMRRFETKPEDSEVMGLINTFDVA